MPSLGKAGWFPKRSSSEAMPAGPSSRIFPHRARCDVEHMRKVNGGDWGQGSEDMDTCLQLGLPEEPGSKAWSPVPPAIIPREGQDGIGGGTEAVACGWAPSDHGASTGLHLGHCTGLLLRGGRGQRGALCPIWRPEGTGGSNVQVLLALGSGGIQKGLTQKQPFQT